MVGRNPAEVLHEIRARARRAQERDRRANEAAEGGVERMPPARLFAREMAVATIALRRAGRLP